MNIADRIAKVAALATSPNAHEATAARAKALKLVEGMDLELLTTLASQRRALLDDLDVENHRLISSKEHANKRTTGDLVRRAAMLLHHYERIDALLAIVALLQGKAPPEPEHPFFKSRYDRDHAKWRERRKEMYG